MTASVAFALILILCAMCLYLDGRINTLTGRLRNVERALSSMNKKYND